MELKMISKSKIQPFPRQPRENFDREKIKELAESIKEQGLLEPIIVRKMDGNYQIIAGQRRWMAYDYLKNKEIPCIIWDIIDDVDAMEKSLIENWHRVDLTDVEKENMLTEIWQTGHFKTISEMSKKIGIPQRTVDRSIRVKKTRDDLSLEANISSVTIESTRGLEIELQKKIIQMTETGQLPKGGPLQKKVSTIKKAPESLKKAIIEDKVDIGDVERFIEIGVPKEMEEYATKELITRKKEKEQLKRIEIKTDEAALKGERKEIIIERSADEKRLEKFTNIRDTVKWWTITNINMIKTPTLQKKAIEYIREIEKYCRELLTHYEEIEYIDVSDDSE